MRRRWWSGLARVRARRGPCRRSRSSQKADRRGLHRLHARVELAPVGGGLAAGDSARSSLRPCSPHTGTPAVANGSTRRGSDRYANALPLVSKRGLENLELGLGRNFEPPHSASSAKAGQKFFADLRPRAGSDLATSMRCEVFSDDLAMPVRHWNILRMLGEVIPERLNVLELLIWREILEPRRRNGGLRHRSSIRPSGLPICG